MQLAIEIGRGADPDAARVAGRGVLRADSIPAMGDALSQLVKSILDIVAIFVTPDWGALVGLLPILLLIGVVGPILSLLVLAWFIYFVRAPRRRLRQLEAQPVAATVVDGAPVYPAGEPYCAVDALVHPAGVTRCVTCRRELLVRCPKCEVVRAAHVEACPQCGLVLHLDRRAVTLAAPAAPPSGGAAAA